MSRSGGDVRRRHLLALAGAGAAIAVAVPAVAAPTILQVGEPVQNFCDALVSVMRAGSSGMPFPQRYNMLAPAIDAMFDVEALLPAVVGPRWSSLPPGEQQRLRPAFMAFLIASWVANFNEFSGQRFDLSPNMKPVGSDEVVQVTIEKMSGDSKKLDFVMRQAPGGWKAVDVLLDGTISQVATQRSDFRSGINGEDASALIASLRQKVTDLSGGTMHT